MGVRKISENAISIYTISRFKGLGNICPPLVALNTIISNPLTSNHPFVISYIQPSVIVLQQKTNETID